MRHPIDRHVGSKLKQARQLRNLSQTEVAKRLELSFQQLQKYENGANRISASKLFELAQILNVPIPFFFEGFDFDEGDASQGETKFDVTKEIGSLNDERLKERILTYIQTLSDG